MRKYISQYQYIIKNISEYSNEILLQKIPMLVRNDGLEKTLSYLERKDEVLYNTFMEYIKNTYKVQRIDEIKNDKGIDVMTYIRIKKELYNLSIKLVCLYDVLDEVDSDKKSIERGRPTLNELKTEEKYLSSKFYNQNKREIIKKGYSKGFVIERKTVGNMVVGFGETSVQEVSIKKHHLLGVPYIPASSIKGVFHHYCLESELAEDIVNLWFGTEEKQGALVFLDAYPKYYTPKEDIMTPHYQQYYTDKTGEKGPKDDDKPIPISFEVVCNAMFRFILYIKNDVIDDDEIQNIKSEFEKCLNQKSFGAKRSIGYGYLEVKESGNKQRENNN